MVVIIMAIKFFIVNGDAERSIAFQSLDGCI